MQLLDETADNPDQRISEDISQFIHISLVLVVGTLNKVVTLFSFIGILWELSGSLNFTLLGHEWHLQGYMVFAALIYSIFGTWATFYVGKPMIKLTFDQQHYEADFRYNLIRLRENGESIAFYKGEGCEKRCFSAVSGHRRQLAPIDAAAAEAQWAHSEL